MRRLVAARHALVRDVSESDLVESLARLPGFRNVLVHEYVGLDLERAVGALEQLQPIRRFARQVAEMERAGG